MPALLQFVNSFDAVRLAELGESRPDHFLRTKIKPLLVDWNPQAEDLASLKKWKRDWLNIARITQRITSVASGRTLQRCATPYLMVILIPGIGMIAWDIDQRVNRG